MGGTLSEEIETADARGGAAPLGVGIVGVGKISEQYLARFPELPGLRLVAVADLNVARAAEVAAEQGVLALTVDELIAHPSVDVVLNLTIPAAHVAIAHQALDAGKHVYGEKPLALDPREADGLLEKAERLGLRVGSAPDTVLGTGIQTSRALLDQGVIGTPVGAAASWTAPGHELWHPAPAFYYQPGGGPLLDMGPYYLTALVTLLGPVVRVSGVVGGSSRARSVATGPLAGTALVVDPSVPTHVTAILEHESGVASSVIVSFEVWASKAPRIEVFGTEGTIAVPDPNNFSDPVEVYEASTREWRAVEPLAGYADAGRGYGLADLAQAVATDRPHRASGELAYHVLEIMDSIVEAGRSHTVMPIVSRAPRPEPVPRGALPNTW